jgi:ubiquinol-cytochrome c reductase cytochrome c subunit
MRIPLRLKRFALPAGLLAIVALPTALLGASPGHSASAAATQAADVQSGKALFETSCISCHGVGGVGTPQGPRLIGVGAASADFYLSTGRMPLPAPDIRARRKRPAFDRTQIDQLVAYVASLGPNGQPIPRLDLAAANVSRGGELFRLNCASCHGFAGGGGALSEGNQAPPLWKATPLQIKEALRIGPGTMPVFSEQTLSDHDADAVVRYAAYLGKANNRGGAPLDYGGPIPEGLVAWLGGLGVLIGVSVWIGRAR